MEKMMDIQMTPTEIEAGEIEYLQESYPKFPLLK